MRQVWYFCLMYEQKNEPGSSHYLLKHFLSKIPSNARVLDVGTATGFLGLLMQNDPIKLFGVEPNESWAKIAEPYYMQVFVGQLEDIPDDFLKEYDVVVCADVIEHLCDPETQLNRLVKLQTPGTKFFISVPNVANIWIRVNLLLGKFEYTNRGILDKTHLHFFTYRSFMNLLISSGLKVEEIKPTPIPLQLVNPFFMNHPIGRFVYILLRKITSLLPTLLGYQFFCFASVTSIK